MKKTKLMRAALLLLVLTLITSCFVGGTFAKYVTEGNSTGTAHVAKWGVNVTATGETFAKEYATDTKNVVNVIAKSVIGADKVVAPGTSGSMAAVKLSGKPEVAVRVNYAATFDVSEWKIAGTGATSEFYCPLQITVGGTTIDGTGFTNAAAFENAVKAEISKYSKNYEAGTDLSDATKVTVPSVSWSWPFSIDDSKDAKDTALGNLAANGKAPAVTLTITTTVTQID